MAKKKAAQKQKVPSAAAVTAVHDLVGRLDVPSGEAFTVEVWLTMDTPSWTVRLMGNSDAGKSVNRLLGQNQPHLLVKVPDLDDGDYVLSMVAILQNPGGQFVMLAKSSCDEERTQLEMIPGKPTRMDVKPVRVG